MTLRGINTRRSFGLRDLDLFTALAGSGSSRNCRLTSRGSASDRVDESLACEFARAYGDSA